MNFFWGAGLLLTSVAYSQQIAGKTVWDGVYTATQSEQGKAAYTDKCAGCHKDDLGGYQGVLKSDKFLEHWREDTLESFFKLMKSTMPRGSPSSLEDEAYVRILAFILRANGFPAGPQPLTLDALRIIQVVEKSGPRELSTGSLVYVVGCLSQDRESAWMLARATKPVRTRNPDNYTAPELKTLETRPLGAQTFGLMDAVFYKSESIRNYKVVAKGFLIKDSGGDRINLTALQAIDSNCEPSPVE